jgi:hypothetical protein
LVSIDAPSNFAYWKKTFYDLILNKKDVLTGIYFFLYNPIEREF